MEKLAVKSTAPHASYDFYNNGTSYFNGAVIVDDALDITGTSRALKIAGTTVIDTSRNLTNIGTITATGKIKTTSGELEFTSHNHKLTTNNANNVLLKSGVSGAMGLLGQDSGSNFKWQLYGDGTAYGFLNAAWNSWNIRKVISGGLYLNNDTTYYIQPESTSNLNNVQAQSYKIGTTQVIDA